MSNIKIVLQQAISQLQTVSESARLDAEVLLAHVLKRKRSYLRAWDEYVLTESEQQAFLALLAQRQHGVPIAYLTGLREFWSRDFSVNAAVLIPRPETELLVELALARIPTQKPCSVLDLGTGSGIIAISLALERPLANISAVDNSLSALQVAQTNAERYQLSQIQFYHSDWFAHVPNRQFDLIVSNPPYIDPDDCHLQQGDVRFEPKTALIAEKHGLSDIEQIIAQANNYLTPQGQVLIEHGYNQQQAVQAIFANYGFQHITTHCDLANQPRVTSAVKALGFRFETH